MHRARPAELWDAWVFASVESTRALDAWRRTARRFKENAFAAYHAALDREELAATVLADRIAPTEFGERLQAQLGRTTRGLS